MLPLRVRDLRWHILACIILIFSYAGIAICFYLSISSGKVQDSMKILGLEAVEEVQGVEEEGLALPHAGKAKLVPGGLAGAEEGQGHEAAVRGAQGDVCLVPGRAGPREGQEPHRIEERSAGLGRRRSRCAGGKRRGIGCQGIAGAVAGIRGAPGLHGRGEAGEAGVSVPDKR